MASIKKKEEKISKYNSFKKIIELSKSHSPNSVLVCTDDEDEWFIDIVEYRTKSQVITNISTIIKKDLQDRLDWYYKNGWIALTKI